MVSTLVKFNLPSLSSPNSRPGLDRLVLAGLGGNAPYLFAILLTVLEECDVEDPLLLIILVMDCMHFDFCPYSTVLMLHDIIIIYYLSIPKAPQLPQLATPSPTGRTLLDHLALLLC